MGEKKVTIMVLKVDLQCEKCYKKVKKVLCKFPQIRDQTYDEKNNQVIIKVVCCSPEKIRDKLCCKGGGAIKSIDILPEKPKEKPKEPEKPKEKPKEAEKPKEKPEAKKEEPKKKPIDADKVKGAPQEAERPKEQPKKAEKPKEEPVLFLVPAYPPVTVSACGMDCYGGHPGCPCQTGYGYGWPVYDSYGGGRSYATSSYCVTRPDCFSEENPQACAIM